MTLIHFELDERTYRRLSIRLRVAHRGGEARLEPGLFQRPFSLPVGDAVPFKQQVDVFIEGHAYPASSGDRQGIVRLRAESIDRKARVFGDRRVERDGTRLRLGRAEPIERIALVASNAYGGGAGTTRYPRNPIGKGFFAESQDPEGAPLPNLENPDDLLTEADLLVGLSRWWTLPRPVLFEPALPTSFPRVALFGLLGAQDCPTGTDLAEVADGDLPPGFTPPRSPAPDFAQEAERRMRLAHLDPGLDVVLAGCLPGGREGRWRAPEPPVAVLHVEGRAQPVLPRAQTLRLRPETGELAVTYAVEHDLHRAFVPGLHARIPIALEVLGVREAPRVPEPVLHVIRRHQATKEVQ